MSQETYEDAVLKSVMWWSEKSFTGKLNQNNGDDSPNGGMSFLLMNMVSQNAQKAVTPDKVKKFEEKLTKSLLALKGKGRYSNELHVDYHPNSILYDACMFAEIDPMCLPCKTFTYIDNENIVNGRYQYGGEWFKL